jgi:hypothetical protein
MNYAGDFTTGSTVRVRFNTHKADGTPITLAGTPAISVYKGSTTESTAGVSLTVDYDSRTGLHDVVIDTSASGAFYAAGNDFDIVITAGTVDGISVVGTVVGSFSIQNRLAAIRAAVGLASANLDTQLGDIKTDTGNLLTRITSTLFSGITSLKQWLGMLAGKQAGDSTAITEIRATGAGSGTFNPTTDSGEAIRDRGDAAWTTGTGGGGGGSAGDGDTPVNHNTGGADTYRVLDNLSAPVDNARLTAYVKADYDADPTTATRQAAAYTGADGRWVDPMMLNTGTAYTIVVDKPGSFDPYTFDVTP